MTLKALTFAESGARALTPVVVLFALCLLVLRLPEGIGFVSGLVFGAAICLHALVFGATASRKALPPSLARVLVAAGVVLAVAGAGLPRLPFSVQLSEAGLFVATTACAALLVAVFFGRASTLRDAEW